MAQPASRNHIGSDAAFAEPVQALPASFRQTVFTYQDGMMLCLLVSACCRGGLLDCLLMPGSEASPSATLHAELPIRELAACCGANPSYLAVALRCLAQQGWLTRHATADGTDWIYRPTETFRLLPGDELQRYRCLGNFLAIALPLERSLFGDGASMPLRGQFAGFVREAQCNWYAPTNRRLQEHFTGALLVPLMVALLQSGRLKDTTLDFDGLPAEAVDLLETVSWIDRKSRLWTEEGELARNHALYLGMMCSYIPMLVRLHEIIFSRSRHSTHMEVGQIEVHVDRKLNVLASGAAHRKYFANVDEIIIDIFNQEPLSAQPRFVMDTGCGDGSWLKHIYQLVAMRTRRGRFLDRYPLLMIGVDYNAVCEEVCLQLLGEASIPALFLTGDITDPAGIAAKLMPHGLSMEQGLHVRSFIDHNRVFEAPRSLAYAAGLQPSGAYTDEEQNAVAVEVLRCNLVEFLQKWTAYAVPHGMVILEGHCVDPAITWRHLGTTHNLVFDTYHGFSHQYPVDFEVFMEAAQEAGLYPVMHKQQRYPSRKPFVSISANYFRAASDTLDNPIPQSAKSIERSGQWAPKLAQANEDGERLHALLYQNGALRHPRAWSHAATGLLLRRVIHRTEALLDAIESGASAQREIVLVDYGTGTGMAAIELLRAYQDNGLLHRCAGLGVRLRLCLLDLPSQWFAKAHEMLKGCPYVEFHAIRDETTGRFLPLAPVVGREVVDIAIASMVFHLIRPEPLASVFQELASILRPGGLLAWNSPDIGPPNDDTVLFHEANRRVRRRIIECLHAPEQLMETAWAMAEPDAAREIVARFRALQGQTAPATLARIAAQADAQILAVPNRLSDIIGLASAQFDTDRAFVASFEIKPDEVLDTLLVPANQRYLGEITDRSLRERIIRGLLTNDVIPALRQGLAGTRHGYAVHWTFGEFIRRP